MDPPNHTAMRRLVGKQMTPRRVLHIEDAVISFFFESRPASDERENEAVDFSGVVSSDAVASGITGRAAKDDGDEDANEDDEEPPPPPPPPSLPLAALPSGAVHSA